jgi:hypothetical protein
VPGPRKVRRLLIRPGTVALLGVAIAGCGHSASVGADHVLRLALTEYQVVPQKVEVTAGELTILVHNVGKLTHNLVITEGDQQIDGTPPILPGTTGELSVVLTPGDYTIGSTMFSDQALGEYGTLKVTK